jgi:hypothetical protein
MPTFLRSLFVRTLSLNSTQALAQTRLRLIRSRRHRRAFVASLLLFALITSMDAQAAIGSRLLRLTNPAAVSSSPGMDRKRIVMLRRNETPEGSRFTLTSDSPLTDYKSFVEAERVCIMIPQAAFVSARRDESGRGFADMRIEQRDENVMLSFRLQTGATVAVNQNFNRLDVIFMTNERANSARSS